MMVVEFEKSSAEVSLVTIDDYREVPYYHAFGKCDCFDMPCYDRRYASAERVSNITLGSFWVIEDVDPSFDTKVGVSMVLKNTQAGEELWSSVGEEFEMSRCDVPTAIAHNAGIVQGKDSPRSGALSTRSLPRGDSPMLLGGTIVCLFPNACTPAFQSWLVFGGC